MPLDPRSAAWLAMLHRIDAPRLHELPVEAARRSYDKLMYAYRGEPAHVAAVAPLRIDRRDHEGGPLEARLYRPAGSETGAPLPAILWLHGGGWVLGSLAAYDPWCRALANASGRAVLALDYRLAPEYRFPAAVDDAWFALRWLARQALALALDPARIAVAGDSAGGTLAAVLAIKARDAGLALDHQVLIYPATDLASPPDDTGPYARRHFLELETMAWFCNQYFEQESDRADWRASPALAPDLRGVAPALLIAAECDPLRPQGLGLARRLEAAGVPLRQLEYPGMVHGFVTMFSLFAEARGALEEIAAALAPVFIQES